MGAAVVKSEVETEAKAAIFRQVEDARAVYMGLLIVGHRVSIAAGEMFWAVPGRDVVDTVTLRGRDPKFSVVCAPSAEALQNLAIKLREAT